MPSTQYELVSKKNFSSMHKYVSPHLYPYYSKCGPSSRAILWELARNTECQALPPSPELESEQDPQMIPMHKAM